MYNSEYKGKKKFKEREREKVQFQKNDKICNLDLNLN